MRKEQVNVRSYNCLCVIQSTSVWTHAHSVCVCACVCGCACDSIDGVFVGCLCVWWVLRVLFSCSMAAVLTHSVLSPCSCICFTHSSLPRVRQLIDFFESVSDFKLVFEKADGGELLAHIQKCSVFTEREASCVTREIAQALAFIHGKGGVKKSLPSCFLNVLRVG